MQDNTRVRNIREITEYHGVRNIPAINNVIQGYDATKYYITNWELGSDGLYVAFYVNSSKEIIRCTSADRDFLENNYAIENYYSTGLFVGTKLNNRCQISLFKRSDNRLLLFVVDPRTGDHDTVYAYMSENGKGTDLVFFTSIINHTGITGTATSNCGVSKAMYTDTGRIILIGTLPVKSGTFLFDVMRICVSDDDGVSWSIKYTASYAAAVEASGQLAQLPDGGLVFYRTQGDGSSYIQYSEDDGENWDLSLSFDEDFADVLVDHLYNLTLKYDPITDILWGFSFGTSATSGLYYIERPDLTKIIDKTMWIRARGYTFNSLGASVFSYDIGNIMIFQISIPTYSHIIAVPLTTIPKRCRAVYHKTDGSPVYRRLAL
jgi:hypothetical protein